MNARPVALALLFLTMSSCERKNETADLVIRGGKIYTVDKRNTIVEAVAVKDDRIIFCGSEEETSRYITKTTRLIDLKGKTMIPGFIEGHGHLMGLGLSELTLDLSAATSFEEIVMMVKEAVGKAEPGQWIIGRGWHQDKWKSQQKMIKGFPTHDAISAVSPDNPVYLTHASEHAGLANARAMTLAGIDLTTGTSPQKMQMMDGEIVRDERGFPTGLFNERAQSLIANHIPKASPEYNRRMLECALAVCKQNGITSFHDAGARREHIDLYHEFKQERKLTTRLYVMITGWDRDLVYEWFKRGVEIDRSHWLTIRSVKLNCDGALGSRGAWLLEPYNDMAGHTGNETLPMDTVLKTARLALDRGFQVCSHAIGDRANREVLNRYELAFREAPKKSKDCRFRIEHAQHLHPDDIPRFGRLNVIPSMQAIHLSSDRPWAIDRLGEKRIREGAYVWKKLLQSGARIMNGTDTPVEPINPIACFYASVTRKTLAGSPAGGYEPDQKMTREQALRSYTADAAFGAFEENIKGSIEPGKLADFTVLSRDILTVPEDELLSTHVVMTITGGVVIFEKDQ